MKEIEEQLIYIYNSGYMAGHSDTVEGCFTNIYLEDMNSYHEDVIKEILSEVTIEVVCPECNRGIITIYSDNAIGIWHEENCPECKGTGKITITLKQAIERLQHGR